MRIPIVDENDTIITHKERNEVLSGDIYRITALLAVDENNNVLLTRRALTKKNNPGAWMMSVAGTVEEGESYDDNIRKETEEELGVILPALNSLGTRRVVGEHNYFCHVYMSQIPHDTLFVFDPHETMDYKWESKENIDIRLRDHPQEFTNGFRSNRDNMKTYIA